MWPFYNSSYQDIVDAKRAERARAIAVVNSDPITAGGNEQSNFLKATATEIVSRIGKGEWTASQVVNAYITRAALAQATTNCLTEVMFDWAKEQAKELDLEFASTKQLRGPLHGVPVSFKDQFDIADYDSSVGFTQWTNRPAVTHADLVTQFLAAGAVLFVKTNVPQTMFAFECSNPVWGRTTNPYNNKYTSGGSSGGEGALLAMDGSALGVGSDIGGSLRIPAAYCGVYSLKPASGRLSYTGARGPVPGFEGIKSVAGPMGRSVEDLKLAARLIFGVQGSKRDVAPVPYREVTLPKKLRFGYYTSDGYIKASPACRRAVLETVEALRKEGHECVEFDVPGTVRASCIFVGLTSADGYKTMLSHLGPDPKEKSLFLVTLGPKLNSIIRAAVVWVIEHFFNDNIFATTIRAARVKPVGEYMELVAQRDAFVQSFYEQVWDRYGFDGIIAPVQALPQLPHGNFSALAVATILYSVMDHAVGCLPVTRVDPSKDQLTEGWINGPGRGSPLIESGVYSGKNPLYDPQAMKGMPVGVQVIGKKWEEEKVLAMMHVVDQALGERGFGPGSWDASMKDKSSF